MYDPGLTLAIAFAAGMLAQTAAHHIRIPGIVLFLITGVILGPDVTNIIHPESLGSALPIIVGFSVAVILFEGGMNLQINRITRERRTIQRLITIGAIITAIGAYFSVKIFLDWNWRSALLFGTLIIVTGPTVITPLLRRLKLKLSVSTILEAEGVFLDAIGAIIAAVTLEIVLSPENLELGRGIVHIITRLTMGVLVGIVSGYIITLMLRFKNLIPEGLENVFTLAMVFVIYQGSNYFTHESGIVAVTIAGFIIGNQKISGRQRDLRHFKESITIMLIGMLFVILAADVRLAEIQALGSGALFVVATLILIIRPLNIVISTFGTRLNVKQKILLSSFAPRGIVAAAIASLFAIELNKNGFDGSQLRAMVFVVITATVVLTGITGGFLAKLLGLRRKSNNGWVILGAHEVGRLLAKTLMDFEEEVICIDSNPKNCQLAEEEGIKTINNNGMEENTLLRTQIDTRKGVIGLTDNEEVNFLFAKKVKELSKISKILIGIKQDKEGVTEAMVEEFGATIPFAFPRDLEQWNIWIKHNKTELLQYKYQESEATNDDSRYFGDDTRRLLLPLTFEMKKTIVPVDNKTDISKDCLVLFLINSNRIDEAKTWFKNNNWNLVQ
ncbi:MAG: hypothetical protein GWP19_00860 [Planctomycetia bacterium]|nr:hypothetical protein [Planctomycetia bacterium]